MSGHDWEQLGLWSAVLASGLYHGVNPAMGWPLAVSNGLLAHSRRALLAALGYLAAGHALAVLAVTLPFGMLAALVAWQAQIRVGASMLLIAGGFVLLLRRGHPRALVRIAPSRLALWSFAVAIAHGAGLMLVPIYLGLCRTGSEPGHQAAATLASANLGMALAVALLHTLAMLAMGGGMAWLVYRYLGLQFVARSWFNLEAVWALSLMLVGMLALGLEAFG
ncbi:hypothetical protein [Cupriavidus taiwanensis]|uniref:Putative transporter n=1 Tax=Cupriavidus taiwanensis TaxID=164546 RepID=A0A375J4N7_9BURK|nr:hypothetical protein [Cupriavidus taiwanensis]SPR99632.1 putative transporter [Cupriavidus taiwanensis]